MLPLSFPVYATVLILQFIEHWGDFLWPVLVTDDRTKTVQLGLQTLFTAPPVHYGPIFCGVDIKHASGDSYVYFLPEVLCTGYRPVGDKRIRKDYRIKMGNVNKNIEEAARATAYVMEWHEEIKNNPLRQKYHFEVPAGWCNDPNGFFRSGWKIPFILPAYAICIRTRDYKMYWGHAVSENPVDWEDLPIALAPVDKCDGGGCWSGCALELDQKVYLMYTGLDARNGMQRGTVHGCQ